MADLAGLLSTGGSDYLSRDDEESLAGEAGDQGQGRSEIGLIKQYLRQSRQAEGGLHSMNTAQASNLVENLGE